MLGFWQSFHHRIFQNVNTPTWVASGGVYRWASGCWASISGRVRSLYFPPCIHIQPFKRTNTNKNKYKHKQIQIQKSTGGRGGAEQAFKGESAAYIPPCIHKWLPRHTNTNTNTNIKKMKTNTGEQTIQGESSLYRPLQTTAYIPPSKQLLPWSNKQI